MKNKLIIISDINGFPNTNFTQLHSDVFSEYYSVKHYDSRELAEIINHNQLTKEEIHTIFLAGGIEKAVSNLILNESDEVSILAFSIGGTIAWKAGLANLKIINLTAFSSTRLRNETEVPIGKIKLYYGQNDLSKPTLNWISNSNLTMKIIENESHDFYKKIESLKIYF